MLDVVIGRHTWILLLSPCGGKVAKYARTCVRRYTHKNQNRKKVGEKKRGYGQERKQAKGKKVGKRNDTH